MTESERDLGQPSFELIWNQESREATAEMFSPNALIRDADIETHGLDGFYAFLIA